MGYKSELSKKKNKLSHDLSLGEMKRGDLFVHEQHGIAKYDGLVHLKIRNKETCFVKLLYRGNDSVYLPVDRLNQIQRFTGNKDTGTTSILDKLGGKSWEEKKKRVKKKTENIAKELIKAHASRVLEESHVASPPQEEYFKLVDDFPFQETSDQLACIDDIESDLTSKKKMDRLLVGDVGFGKTEIAIRTTMRTVLDGRQALILVPTTVLSYQHYNSFRMRLEKYLINVAQVNRFIATSEQKKS